MNKLKIFDHLQSKFLHKMHAPMMERLRAVDPIATREVTTDMILNNREYEHTLTFKVRSLIPENEVNRPGRIEMNEEKVMRIIAEALYKEVFDDLLDISVHAMERHYDPELNQMIDTLMRKLRP